MRSYPGNSPFLFIFSFGGLQRKMCHFADKLFGNSRGFPENCSKTSRFWWVFSVMAPQSWVIFTGYISSHFPAGLSKPVSRSPRASGVSLDSAPSHRGRLSLQRYPVSAAVNYGCSMGDQSETLWKWEGWINGRMRSGKIILGIRAVVWWR